MPNYFDLSQLSDDILNELVEIAEDNLSAAKQGYDDGHTPISDVNRLRDWLYQGYQEQDFREGKYLSSFLRYGKKVTVWRDSKGRFTKPREVRMPSMSNQMRKQLRKTETGIELLSKYIS